MGLGGKDAALLAAIIGGQALSSITAPEGQELQSFSGETSVDPHRLLTEGLDATREARSVIEEELRRPTLIETRMPSLPSFVGGGLPFAISAPAQDQAYVNPNVARLPLGNDSSTEPPPRPPRGPNTPRPLPAPGDPPLPPDVSGPYGSGVTRRPLPPSGGNVPVLGSGNPDDTSQPLAAASLLLQSLTQQRRAG